MRFYALVIWRTRGVVPTLLQLIYLGDGQVVSYAPDEQDLLATERLVEALWRAIEDRAGRPVSGCPARSFACRWCSYPGALPGRSATSPRRCPEPPELSPRHRADA